MPRNLRSSDKSTTAAAAAGPAAKKTNKSAKSAADAKSSSLLRLPSDAVSSALLYLDVDGVPKAAVMCKEWNAILKSVEEELWLSLIRKHYPIAERIARKLPPPAIASSVDGDDEEVGGDDGQQPPAKRGRLAIDWKDQFRRAREMCKQDKVPSPETITTVSRPEPKPLTSYFFQVDLILYKGVKGKKKSEWERPGVVSAIVDGDDLKFEDNSIMLSIKSEGIAEELSKYSFTSFDIKLVLFDNSTGKRALFYKGAWEDQIDANMFVFEPSDVPVAELYEAKISCVANDIPGNPWIGCMLYVSKNGCICDCHHGEDWDLFTPPSTCPCCDHVCKCCSCKRKGKGSKWSCFWGMDIELSLSVFWEWDLDHISGKEGQLEILENVKFS